LHIEATAGKILAGQDPSDALSQVSVQGQVLKGKVVGRAGGHTVFVRVKKEDWEAWMAADFIVRPPIKPPRPEPPGSFHPVAMAPHFNASLTEIHALQYDRPRGPDGVQANGRFR
jgi:hypothetical protein